MLLMAPVRRVPVLVTVLCAVAIVAALYGAFTAPLDPDVATTRDRVGHLVVTAVALNGPAQADAVRRGDLAIGHVGHGTAIEWIFQTPRGIRLTLAPPPLTSLTVLVVALGWTLLLLGFVVLVISPDRTAAAAFWRLSLLLGATLALAPAGERGGPWVLALHFTILRLCGPALLELTLRFPVGTRLLDRHLLLRVLLWLPALAALLLYRGIVAGVPNGAALPGMVLCGYVLVAVVRLGLVCLHPQTAPQRAQVRYLAMGLLAGVLPSVVLTLAPQVMIGHPLVSADATLLTLGALPLCIGLAIARVELFGIVLRQRTRWLLRRMVLTASVVAVAGLVMLAAQEPWRLLLPFLDAGIAAVIVLVYHHHRPMRAQLRSGDNQIQAAGGKADLPDDEDTAGVSVRRALSTALLLTPREGAVLASAARGLRTRQIADHLQVSERTVEAYFTRIYIYIKLNVHTRAEAVRVALEHNLLRHSMLDDLREDLSHPAR